MYALTFAPLGFLALALVQGRPISKGVYLVFCSMVVAAFGLVYGFRDFGSGADSYVYATAFEVGGFERWEPGYVLWLRFLRLFGSGYEVYFGLGTVIKLCLLAWAAFNVSKVFGYALGALFLVSVVYSFTLFDLYTNALRQGLAMTLAIVSLALLLRGRSGASFLFAAFAPAVHVSYVLFLATYLFAISPIGKYSFVVKTLVVGSVASLAFLVSGVGLLDLLRPLLITISEPLGFQGKFEVYSSITRGSFSELNVFGQLKVYLFLVSSGLALLFLSGRAGQDKMVIVIIVSALTIIYNLFAFSGYSYRVLYLVSALFPFVVVGVLHVVHVLLGKDLLVQILALLWLLVLSLNYFYFVVMRGGLSAFGYFVV